MAKVGICCICKKKKRLSEMVLVSTSKDKKYACLTHPGVSKINPK